MKKTEFLKTVGGKLPGLSRDDVERWLDFYNEMIDDRMEEGMSEGDAVAALGTVDEVVRQILQETPLTRLVKEAVSPKRTLRIWEIVLLILGSPMWLPLLAAAVIVIASLYVVLWSVIISLYAVDLAVGVSSLGLLAEAVMLLVGGNVLPGILFLGLALLLAGVSILLFLGFWQMTRGAAWLSCRSVLWLKACFAKGGNKK